MDHSETTSRWEQPPVWNGTAKTWETFWTNSFDTKQALTLGPRPVRSRGHLPQVHEVGLSVPRVELVKNTSVETLLTALRHSGLVRKVPTDIAAKLREMLGPSMRRKIGSEAFAACGIRFGKCFRELGQALKRLDHTLDAGKLFHPVMRGILLLANSGLNGSEVSAVLATQENSNDYDRAMSGLVRAVGEPPTLSARPRKEDKPRILRRWLVR